jgi:hypothetical protein
LFTHLSSREALSILLYKPISAFVAQAVAKSPQESRGTPDTHNLFVLSDCGSLTSLPVALASSEALPLPLASWSGLPTASDRESGADVASGRRICEGIKENSVVMESGWGVLAFCILWGYPCVVWLPIALTCRICHDAQYRDA